MKKEQVEATREALKKALAEQDKFDATSLAREIGRGDGYVRDFLNGRKDSLGVIEVHNIETLLDLPIGTLTRPGGALGGRISSPFRLKTDPVNPPIPSASGSLVSAGRSFGPVRVDSVVAAGIFKRLDFPDDLGLVISAPRDPIFPYAPQVAFQVGGDSMNQAKPKPINDGDFIICALWEHLEIEEEDGLIVVAEQTIDGGMYIERTLKELRVFPQHYECVPNSSNPNHETIVIPKAGDRDDGRTARIHSLLRFVFDSQPLPNGRPRLKP